MKKSTFVAMLLGTVSGVLFALGMCMALIPDWYSFGPGVALGCAGIVLGLVTVAVWRHMEHKQPIQISRKAVASVAVGMCWECWVIRNIPENMRQKRRRWPERYWISWDMTNIRWSWQRSQDICMI